MVVDDGIIGDESAVGFGRRFADRYQYNHDRFIGWNLDAKFSVFDLVAEHDVVYCVPSEVLAALDFDVDALDSGGFGDFVRGARLLGQSEP
ncbi:MAG: hypothetical protein ACK57U_07760, partial [Planctomycetota bacterium]